MTAPAGALPTLRRTPLSRLAGVDRLAVAGAVLLGIIVLAAVFAPWIAPYPEDGGSATHPTEALLPPSAEHWFGTDQVGRDVLSRVLFGARTSLVIVVAVLAISGTVGVILGVVAGYAGGWVRDVIMRVTDVFLAFPALLLSLALAVVLQPSVTTVIVAISATWWPWYTRLTASVASSVATRGFVDAARCLGVPAPLIVFRHVLPNALTPVLVQLSLDGGGVILTAAALSYLGLGAHEPTAEWGLMVEQGQALFTTNWWVVTFPGLAILITAFACNMLGEGLRARLAR
ncbi:cytochrome c550 [Thermobispora bispora]|jgi:peptide/nickel transport system permease protein|uniref:Binding-protein-dependent transport systems inner membrane component n=1 Tax=Thermobispora bispora (strain ATCC 19993 / DSM 43833 / CBS 139.67 / JCM 10125 / KCTC 9307 / NBRC 14880 / R51) TaxID=469371 RepID=D6Y703_THEBD|nr:ABC transporter permease [Thermobispora bispora]MBO2475493.1 ABC transporter permease [Actinomycetales bacterium]MDI9579524.1 ABC transporter permease [Thermobispora sp.]ADG89644.1 binding-protein-dependent transport systems inner membrane component [Thermobispora bispora DSM 43833]MBX6166703.1 ABC transporter permease [Thermobispora bispora]QSI49257.1 ABC transporter permease [Thermobispora bispora]